MGLNTHQFCISSTKLEIENIELISSSLTSGSIKDILFNCVQMKILCWIDIFKSLEFISFKDLRDQVQIQTSNQLQLQTLNQVQLQTSNQYLQNIWEIIYIFKRFDFFERLCISSKDLRDSIKLQTSNWYIWIYIIKSISSGDYVKCQTLNQNI